MPLPVVHMLVGASLAEAMLPPQTPQLPRKVLAAALLAVAPDLDFLLILALGLDRASHRGWSHSLTLAAVAGITCFLLLGRDRARESIVYFVALLSHGVLDAVTSAHARGVELLWPWTQSRYAWGLTSLFESQLGPQPTWLQMLGAALEQTIIGVLAFGLLLWVVRRVRGRVSSAAPPGRLS